ncbi:hypothetical protein [Legionella bononiensis]|uniref:Uncharacterized protein n=1 Tax=Legionella bononiensis TaxID=2793102 RepID=A0ABS1WDA6_9GAMM|nr:hypothetical protein [Legionella bononiensis]MBL7527339.1 hypothetical protein [Legionella bononiensis]
MVVSIIIAGLTLYYPSDVVLGFWNNEVQQQFDLVMDVINNYLMNDI